MLNYLNSADLQPFSDHLQAGGVIGLPTETVYGLAADVTSDKAVASIYEIKGRPSFNPLIIHGSSIKMLEDYAIFNDMARKLAQAFWPGPLTMVLPRREGSGLSHLVTAGLDTVAVRIPNHPLALALIDKFGKPLAAPSANPSGRMSPTRADDLRKELGLEYVLDGGPATVGLESTIIDLTSTTPTVLRFGGIEIDELEKVIGPIDTNISGKVKAPGMLLKHYAPSITLRMNAKSANQCEAYLGFGDTSNCDLNLSPSGDLKEAASNLFSMLRELDDASRFNGIAVSLIPNEGLGIAINDRLTRAARG